MSGLLPRIISISGFAAQNQMRCTLHTSTMLNAGKWPNWKMIKDYKQRKCVERDNFERMNLIVLYKSKILPPEITDIARADIAKMPRDGGIKRTNRRCMVTSRPRGVVRDWRLSRFIYRDEADHGRLSGIQRAKW